MFDRQKEERRLVEELEEQARQIQSAGDTASPRASSEGVGPGTTLTGLPAEEEESVVTTLADGTVVVEYPKTPSIVALVTAILDMLQRRNLTGPQPFDDPAWPPARFCEDAALRLDPPLPSVVLMFDAKNVSIHAHIDFGLSSRASGGVSGRGDVSDWEAAASQAPANLAPPLCTGPTPSNTAHTLEHLHGVAGRAQLSGRPEPGLLELFRTLSGRPMAADVVAARVRDALARAPTDWVALSSAALYWRIIGNATQVCAGRGVSSVLSLEWRRLVHFAPVCCILTRPLGRRPSSACDAPSTTLRRIARRLRWWAWRWSCSRPGSPWTPSR